MLIGSTFLKSWLSSCNLNKVSTVFCKYRILGNKCPLLGACVGKKTKTGLDSQGSPFQYYTNYPTFYLSYINYIHKYAPIKQTNSYFTQCTIFKINTRRRWVYTEKDDVVLRLMRVVSMQSQTKYSTTSDSFTQTQYLTTFDSFIQYLKT